MIEAVLFDLDGTLLNTIEDIADSLNVILHRNGYEQLPLDKVRAYVGNGFINLLRRSVRDESQKKDVPGEEEISEMFKELVEYYSEHCLIKTKPYAGIMEMLAELKKRGVKTAIVTNKNIKAARELGKLVFKDYISVVVGEDDLHGIRKKPEPDMVQSAAKQLGAALQDCIYVGDSEVDVQTAENSKMPGVCVLWGFRTRDQLLDAGAKKLIEKPMELLSIVEGA